MFSILKKIYKKHCFLKNSQCGENLSVGVFSNCTSNNKENIVIGNNCHINGRLFSYENGRISVGDNTFINTYSFIGAMDNIVIGNCVIIATNVRIFDNNNHPTDPQMRENMCQSGFYNKNWEWCYAAHKPVVINDNVWIGEYSTILKGVTIGKGSIVASHSVVTKDVPDYCIVAGNPAKVVKFLKTGDVNEKS